MTHTVEGPTHNDDSGPTCNLTQLPFELYTDTRYQTTNAHDDGHLRVLYTR